MGSSSSRRRHRHAYYRAEPHTLGCQGRSSVAEQPCVSAGFYGGDECLARWSHRRADAIGRGGQEGQIPVFYGGDPDNIPINDNVITQVIPLKNIPPDKLRVDLGPMICADADISVDAASNALVVTDVSAKINSLTQIIQKLDNLKTVPLKLEYKQLQYTNAAMRRKTDQRLCFRQWGQVPGIAGAGAAAPVAARRPWPEWWRWRGGRRGSPTRPPLRGFRCPH